MEKQRIKMFDKFKQLGDLKKMRDQALALQKQLAEEKVVVEEDGVRVVVSGDMKVEELETGDASDETIKNVVNKALKKAQEKAAQKLAQMSGGLGGLSGLLK